MLSIHSLKLSEITILQKLAREIWQEHYIKIISQEQIDYMLNLFYSENRIRKEINEGIIWEILWQENEPIGYLSCKVEIKKLYISKIYLKNNLRGMGLGKKLANRALDLAEINNKKAVYLNVNKYNSKSISFYEHLGFNKVKEEVNNIGNGFIMDDFVYEKKIR